MGRVHRAQRLDQAVVEGPDHPPGGVARLVDRVVPRHPGVVLVVVGDRLPQVHGAVLEVPVLPERRHVGGVVGVPVLVLRARQRVQVNHAVDPVLRQQADDAVEVAEAVLDDLHRPVVGLEVPVVHRDSHAVDAHAREQGGVLGAEEGGQQPVEEQLLPLLAQHAPHGVAHGRLVGRVAGDEVLHVHPAAEAHPPQPHGASVGRDEAGSGHTQGHSALLGEKP